MLKSIWDLIYDYIFDDRLSTVRYIWLLRSCKINLKNENGFLPYFFSKLFRDLTGNAVFNETVHSFWRLVHFHHQKHWIFLGTPLIFPVIFHFNSMSWTKFTISLSLGAMGLTAYVWSFVHFRGSGFLHLIIDFWSWFDVGSNLLFTSIM